MADLPNDLAVAQLLRTIALSGKERERALRKLFDAYARQFERYFVRHRVPEAEAEELVQDTFVDIVRGAVDFRGEAPVRVWLWTIARNRLLGFHRRDRREVTLDEEGWTALLDSAAFACTETKEPWKIDCLHKRMQAFCEENPERAACLEFIVTHDWGVTELAAFLNRTVGAAKEYLSQCRKKLRQYLAACEEWTGEYE